MSKQDRISAVYNHLAETTDLNESELAFVAKWLVDICATRKDT